MSNDLPMLAYVTVPPVRIRRAGIFLIAWAALQVPISAAIAGYAVLQLARILPLAAGAHSGSYRAEMVFVLMLLLLALPLCHFGVLTLRKGLLLLRGNGQPLARHLFWVSLVEILAYCCSVFYLVVYFGSGIWSTPLDHVYALFGLAFCLILPIALTVGRITLRRACEPATVAPAQLPTIEAVK